ncbi:unnamed protein product [Oikopleura dioica]|uniref:Uncharacterized protein n=1 Tax=Oikopleura dioica TaxID=34765 RepID=E4YNJ8_OIKDI|nr:unnamed protein product [Oikopleura dioica]
MKLKFLSCILSTRPPVYSLPIFNPNSTPSTTRSTTVKPQIDLASRRTPECKALTRAGRPVKLDLSIFNKVPEDVLYTAWGEWQSCDKITKRQIRVRSCKKIDGIVFDCNKENTLVSRECEELARIDRPARPDPISLDEIEYCDNQWGRFLKDATVTCLLERRCSLFRNWDDKRLTWLMNCFPKWGLSGTNKKTFRMRAVYQRKLASSP